MPSHKDSVIKHPNKMPFTGILAILDEPSDKAPTGARGHRVLLTKEAAKESLKSLIGMGINISDDLSCHNAESKIGIIEKARIVKGSIAISGYIWNRDLPNVVNTIQASAEKWGMSYELADAHVEDMSAEIWKLTQVTFTGAAIILREKAAYKNTNFALLS